MVPHDLVVSHLEPFGARLDIEVIKTPAPLAAKRPAKYINGPPTTYLHFVLNQRTLPLGKSYAQCGNRDDGMLMFLLLLRLDHEAVIHAVCLLHTYTPTLVVLMTDHSPTGWCELGAFLAATADAYELSMYDFACFGDYPAQPYGAITNGNPITSPMRL